MHVGKLENEWCLKKRRRFCQWLSRDRECWSGVFGTVFLLFLFNNPDTGVLVPTNTRVVFFSAIL